MESVAHRKLEPSSARVYWLDHPHREPSPDLELAWRAATERPTPALQRSIPMPHPLAQPSPPPHLQTSLRSVCTRCHRLKSLHSGECPPGYAGVAGMSEKYAGLESPRTEMLKEHLRSDLPPLVSDPDAFANDAPSGWNRILQQCTRSISNVSAPSRSPLLSPSPSSISPLAMTSSASLPPSSTALKYSTPASNPRQSCLQAAVCVMSRAHRTAPPWAMRSCRIGLLRSPLARQPHMRNLTVASVQAQNVIADHGEVKQPPKSAGMTVRPEVSSQVSAERGGDCVQLQHVLHHAETLQDHLPSTNFVAESKGKHESNERDDNTSGKCPVECTVNGSGDANHLTLNDDATHKDEIEEIELYELERILEEMTKNELKTEVECVGDKRLDKIESTDSAEESTPNERVTSDEESLDGNVGETFHGTEEEKATIVFRTEPMEDVCDVVDVCLDENLNVITTEPISEESELKCKDKKDRGDSDVSGKAEEDSSGISRSTTSSCSVSCSTATGTASKSSSTSVSVTTSSTTTPSWRSREDEAAFGSFWGYWSDEGVPRGHPLDGDAGDDNSEVGSSAVQGDSISEVGPAPSVAYVPDLCVDPPPADGTSSNKAAGDLPTNSILPVAETSTDNSRPKMSDTGYRDGSFDGDACMRKMASNTLLQLCLAHNVDGLHADLSRLSLASSNVVPPTPTPSLASIDPSDPMANDLALLAQAIRNPCVCPRGGHLIFRNRPCLHISIPGVSPENTDPILPSALSNSMENHANNNATRRGAGRGRGTAPNGVNLRDRSAWSRKRGGGAGGSSLATAGRGAGGGPTSASPRTRGPASRSTGAAALSIKGTAYSGSTTGPAAPATGTAGFGGCCSGRRGSTPRPAFTRTTWSHKVRPEEAAATAAQMM